MPELTDPRSPAPAARGPHRRLRLLHLVLVLGETNSQYNEHCLPQRHDHDIAICTYFAPRLESPPEIRVFAGDDTMRGFLRAIRAALRSGPYDAVHVHSPHMSTLLPVALAVLAQPLGVLRSTVMTVHDSFYDFKPRNKLLLIPGLALFRRTAFCSRAAYDSFPRSWRRVVGRRARVIQNSADLARVDRAIEGTERGGDPSGFAILSIGRLEPVKDPMTLLASFGRVTDSRSRVVLVGTGSLEPELARRIGDLGLRDRVELTGLIPREEVFRSAARADLFVSTSRGEGLPVSVMEAMATGCPAVLSDIPPHRELIDGADVVPLVAPGDVEGFTRQIDRFAAMSPEERADIGRRCREQVRSRFPLRRMLDEYEQLYGELIAEGRHHVRSGA